MEFLGSIGHDSLAYHKLRVQSYIDPQTDCISEAGCTVRVAGFKTLLDVFGVTETAGKDQMIL